MSNPCSAGACHVSSAYVGKPSPSRLKRLLADNFGAQSDRVIVGPGPGLDAAVLRLDDGRVMVIAEDPIFPAPGLPLEVMGQFTVHIGASDVAVTGVKPTYMTYTLLLPRTAPESDARTIIESISHHCRDLGITVAGGHTGWYDAVTIPTVGGVAVWGFAEGDRWVSPGGAQDGDIILLTKGPAVEAAALLAIVYRERLEQEIGEDVTGRACARADQITVVKDALLAFEAGGVHAMHDATEGGVLGGLWEMAASSGLGIEADLDAVAVPEDIARVADALDFDPWCAISEGTLLVAASPGAADRVRSAWSKAGIESWQIGRFTNCAGEITVRRKGRKTQVPEPGEDPFWALFFAGISPG
jgi:hydrogenase expression/formation protein HypE